MEKTFTTGLIFVPQNIKQLQHYVSQNKYIMSDCYKYPITEFKNSAQINAYEYTSITNTLLTHCVQWNNINYTHQNISIKNQYNRNIVGYCLTKSLSTFDINYQTNYNQNSLYTNYFFKKKLNNLNQNVNDNLEIKTNLFTFVIDNLQNIITDEKEIKNLKNYFNSFSLEQLFEILTQISLHFLEISKNLSGVRNINNLLTSFYLKGSDLIPILQLVLNNFNEIFLDVNARKIIRQLLNFHIDHIESKICMQIAMNLLTLINDKEKEEKHKQKEKVKGNPAAQYILKILSPYNENKTKNIHNLLIKNKTIIIESIICNAAKLSKGRNGSVLILGIFEEYKLSLITKLLPDFVELSTNKYSSRIIEKMFKSTEPEIKNTVYALLNTNILTKLACNHYGNYVIQKAIEQAPNELMVKKLLDICAEIVIENENDRYCIILSGQLSGQHKYFKSKRKVYRDGFNRIKGIIKGD